MSSDPYVVSSALRRRFREDKKVALEKQGRDDGLRDRYGLHEEVDLGNEDVELGREMWEAGRERAGLAIEGAGSGSSSGAGGAEQFESSTRATKGTPVTRKGKGRAGGETTPDLASLLRKTTAKKYDPFSDSFDSLPTVSPSIPVRVRTRLKEAPKTDHPDAPLPAKLAGGMAVLAGYESD